MTVVIMGKYEKGSARQKWEGEAPRIGSWYQSLRSSQVLVSICSSACPKKCQSPSLAFSCWTKMMLRQMLDAALLWKVLLSWPFIFRNIYFMDLGVRICDSSRILVSICSSACPKKWESTSLAFSSRSKMMLRQMLDAALIAEVLFLYLYFFWILVSVSAIFSDSR